MANTSVTQKPQSSPFKPSGGPVFTLANQLTLLRMLLIPAFVLLVVYGRFGWALLVFLIAGLTDALDGLIARQAGQKSELGAWLDPAADKLLLASTFIVLTLPNIGLVNRIPIWLTVLVISRDVGIVLTVAIVNLAVTRRTFRPTVLGKAATVVYVLTGVVALYANWVGRHLPIVDAFVYAAGAVTLLSAVEYLVRITRGLATDR
jgi:cardiolipin synthase